MEGNEVNTMSRRYGVPLASLALLSLLSLLPVAPSRAQSASTAPSAPGADAETVYTKTIQGRADKIVATLGLTDPAKRTRVRDLIAGQYRKLRDLQAAQPAAPGQGLTPPTPALTDLHRQYLAQLSADLTPEQVDKVKDGMTYGVLPLTYRVYQEMLPTLTERQKAHILADLAEARERAMDGGTSKEKHAWFGKYKGRINNYLAAEGYDVKKAEKALVERQKTAAAGTTAPAAETTGDTK